MRRGHSLAELLLVLAVLAAITAFGVTRLAALADRRAAVLGAERVAIAHRRARMLALANGRPVTLVLAGDSLVAHWLDVADAVWREPGPAADGATLEPARDSMVYAPNGFAIGVANGSWLVRRGGEAAEVLVSRFGRVRMVRNAN